MIYVKHRSSQATRVRARGHALAPVSEPWNCSRQVRTRHAAAASAADVDARGSRRRLERGCYPATRLLSTFATDAIRIPSGTGPAPCRVHPLALRGANHCAPARRNSPAGGGAAAHVHGERKRPVNRDARDAFYTERTPGTFSRRIELPERTTGPSVTATFENGVSSHSSS
jgi:hypothetical protein